MFSDFVVAASDEIIKTRTTESARVLKASWKRWATEIANEMNIVSLLFPSLKIVGLPDLGFVSTVPFFFHCW